MDCDLLYVKGAAEPFRDSILIVLVFSASTMSFILVRDAPEVDLLTGDLLIVVCWSAVLYACCITVR
jgi:hypothetical protein